MNKKITEIIFLLDRSGSMAGLEEQTIQGYNDFLDEQDTYDGQTLVTTILFDDHYEILYDREPAKCAHLSEKKYYVRGTTALLDAIGKTINHVHNRIEGAEKKLKPKQLFFIVTTDGLENASGEYSYRQVKKLVKKRQEEENWRFLFFGANIDAFSVGRNLGIPAERSRSFDASEKGVGVMMGKLKYFIELERKDGNR